MSTTSADFENFSDDDELWLSDLETRAIDLENELSVWREARQRALAEDEYEPDPEPEPVASPPHESFRRVASPADRRVASAADRRVAGTADGRVAGAADRRPQASPRPPVHTAARRAASRSQQQAGGRTRADDARTRALIDHGRRTVRRGRFRRGHKILIGLLAAAVAVTVLVMVVFGAKPSWPPSVPVVQNEITTACQNPNVVSEPNQVNFACDKATSQILWVFSLISSGDNGNFTDAKTGRLGLEPISPAQGGAVAWSLNLHHPYNPYNAIDSLQVAARAINNIIGGASLVGSNGRATVQPGLESDPANCARYTGSAAIVTRAGYPAVCATAVTTSSGQAALVADVYQRWFVGAPATFAQDAGVLFENANDPGNAQVQAILKSLFGPSA